MIDISIITINYNQSELTKEFIDSVIEFTHVSISYEIIVVDNCSSIESFKNLKHLLKDYKVKIIRNNINSGFGGGNMFGVQFASGNYLAFINNDILFIEDSFTPLINFLKNNPKVGVIAPQQLDKDLKPAYCYDYFHGIRRLILGSWSIDFYKKRKRKKILYNEPFSVDFIQGCFMIFDKSKFAEVGGFDTNLFLYYEEMDICYRLKQKGFESYFVPTTQFIHLKGASTKKNYLIKKELNNSRLYVLRKNHNYIKYNCIRYYFLIKWLFKSILSPKYFDITSIILKGSYSENSLKHKQKADRFLTQYDS